MKLPNPSKPAGKPPRRPSVMDTVSIPPVEDAVAAYAEADGPVCAPGPEASAAARAVEAADGPDAAAPSAEELRALRSRRRFLDVWTLVGAILLTGVIVYLLGILAVPVSIVIWTVIIVFCLRGMVGGLEKRGVNRTVGTALAYVAMAAVLGLIGFLLFSPMFGLNAQFADLMSSIPQYVDALTTWGNDLYARYSHVFEDETVKHLIDEVQANLTSWASAVAQGSASGLVGVGTVIANGLMALGFALVIAFWILMELPAIGRECARLIGPRHVQDAEFLHCTFTRVMGGYIKGTLLQCAIIGVACGILFAVLGIPNAAALGGITGVLNIIPIIGPWLGGAATAVVAVFASPLAALIALVGTILIQQFVYTFISPKIMSSSVDVHPALTLMALMVGSALGGAMSGLLGSLVGMLASIPAVAVMKSVFVYYFEKRTGRRVVAEDGVFFKGTTSETSGNAPDPMADAVSPHPDSTAAMERIELARAEGRRGPFAGWSIAAPDKAAKGKAASAGKRGKKPPTKGRHG
ncbi:AI-2E family transporter [Adlercreutzia faecimuris]|uniref:AI-2E family transporter n=1 Tax=Adlercreutzia faecimuris TaxID=2897341 RepID=A0ABS9WH29_9ACTN|nr:AI-2E family transporter [Adlercreutzia sp. JBNU-10]MCI2241561.1 AI-2E family transporter [Adlercreutzia sp. JBNU-10]